MVALKADLAAKLVGRDAAAAGREIGDVGDIARDALAQMRQAVSGIRTARIAAELAAARLLLETDGIGLDVAMAQDALGDDLAPEVECALALVLREAVTNVQRHARARRARIELARDDDGIRLRVVDDGRGGAMVPGTGIAGMRQRVAALGGRLQIDGRPGRTCLEAFVPVQGRPA